MTTAKDLRPRESFMLLPQNAILQTCVDVNQDARGMMDHRPWLDPDKLQDLCKRHPELMYFFAQKRFLERPTEWPTNYKVDDQWLVNSKFDEEWAANIFSDEIELLGTGIYKLDDVLKGGFRLYRDERLTEKRETRCTEPCTVSLQGRPGTGKTTIALQIFSNFAAQGYSSVYITAEQSIESLKRTIRRFCHKTDWTENSAKKVVRCRLATLPQSDRGRLAAELAKYVAELPENRGLEHVDAVPEACKLALEQWKTLDPDKQAAAEKYRKALKDADDMTKRPAASTKADFCPEGLSRPGEFFVAIYDVEDGHEFSRIQEEVRGLVERGWHGIIVAPMDEHDADEQGEVAAADHELDDNDELDEGDTSSSNGAETSATRTGAFIDLKPKQLVTALQEIQTDFGITPSWLAIDSVSAFEDLGSRRDVLKLRNLLKKRKLPTSLLYLNEFVSDDVEDPTELEVLCDKVIQLGERRLQIAGSPDSASNYMQRYLEVKKCRLGPFHRGKHPIAIKSYSVKVYRSIAILLKVTGKRRRNSEPTDDQKFDPQTLPLDSSSKTLDSSSKTLRFGIEGLDGQNGLGDCMREGSVTVLSGPPGSHKTGIATHFLLEAPLAYYRAHKKRIESEVEKSDSSPDERETAIESRIADEMKNCPRSIVYSFGGDRRGIESGLRSYVDSDGHYLYRKEIRPNVNIRDISPGYLFPEAFVEDLIDTLQTAETERKPIKRIVFDSFDSVHAAFPLMRMDEFLWKVIFQVCWDYRVSALVKISKLDHASSYYRNMADLVTSMADNVIQLSANDQLQVIDSERQSHPRRHFSLETQFRYRSIKEAKGAGDDQTDGKKQGLFRDPSLNSEVGLLLRAK